MARKVATPPPGGMNEERHEPEPGDHRQHLQMGSDRGRHDRRWNRPDGRQGRLAETRSRWEVRREEWCRGSSQVRGTFSRGDLRPQRTDPRHRQSMLAPCDRSGLLLPTRVREDGPGRRSRDLDRLNRQERGPDDRLRRAAGGDRRTARTGGQASPGHQDAFTGE